MEKRYKVIKESKDSIDTVFEGLAKECFVYVDERSTYNEEKEKWLTKDGCELYVERNKQKK